MKRWRPLHGMYRSMEAELEVQRRKVIGPIKVHVDSKGIIDGLQKA